MNIHPKNKDALWGNLLVGGNSPDTKPLAVLAALDISASAIASAPLPQIRWKNKPLLINDYAQKRIQARDRSGTQPTILDSCPSSQIHLWSKSKI